MIPVFDVSRVLELAKTSVFDLVKYVAIRAFLISLCVTIVPIAIYKGWMMITEYIFQAAQDQTGTGDLWSGSVIQLTGLGAWIALKIRLAEAFSVFASALSVKFTLSFLRR